MDPCALSGKSEDFPELFRARAFPPPEAGFASWEAPRR
jgi:hypothetical protein